MNRRDALKRIGAAVAAIAIAPREILKPRAAGSVANDYLIGPWRGSLVADFETHAWADSLADVMNARLVATYAAAPIASIDWTAGTRPLEPGELRAFRKEMRP